METQSRAARVHERSLERLVRWSPQLFLFASVILLVAALHRGAVLLFDEVSRNAWVSVVKLFGRMAALLGIGGLTLQISHYNPRLGKVTQAVAAAAVLSTLLLISLLTADHLGLTLGLVPVVGLGTFLFSVGTYSLSGMAIVRTEAFPRFIGAFLLAAAASLLLVVFGMLVLPLQWIGLLAEGVLFLLYLGLGYALWAGEIPTAQTEPASDMTP